MASAPKKVSTDTETAPAIEAEAPKVEAPPVYDRNNLQDVLARIRALVVEIKAASADLAFHYTKHSRSHHPTGQSGQPALEAPAAHDPVLMARLHSLQAAIGEFVHNAGARL